MITKHYSQEKLSKDIIEIVSKYIDINDTKIFFFGSRVYNIKNDRSDIDIGIEYKEQINLSVFSKIEEEIDDLDTLYTIDVVDFKDVSPEFRSVALKKTIPIYGYK